LHEGLEKCKLVLRRRADRRAPDALVEQLPAILAVGGATLVESRDLLLGEPTIAGVRASVEAAIIADRDLMRRFR
jgi:hypothetical protein